MKTVIYLFNGCGWGDHFLAIPFINNEIKKNGYKNVMIITYQNHIDNLFKNFNCQFIGIDNPQFCFERIKYRIKEFNPKKIFSFNAFSTFDFDFHAKRFFKESQFFGKFNEIGVSIRHPFKNFAHIRDQYFLLANEKTKYKSIERQFYFNLQENKFFQSYFKEIIGEISLDKIIVLHLDSEERKLWNSEHCRNLITIFLKTKIKVVLVGQVKNDIVSGLIKDENLIIINEKDIRPVFWLVSNCHFFVGIDSVFAHVADAYNINSLILFSDYNSHEWYHNSPNVTTIYPDPGMMTRDISFQEVLFELNCKFPFEFIN
jgi:ADP-heptose:LPS heptosyltransferase